VFHSSGAIASASRELSPDTDLIERFERLRGDAFPWLLDSALPVEGFGRYSFAGADPYALVRATGTAIEVDVRRSVRPGMPLGINRFEGDPLEMLRALCPATPVCSNAELPFVGGAVGYLGYELAARIEEFDFRGKDDLALPDLYFLLVDRLIAFDRITNLLSVHALGFADDSAEAAARADAAVAEFTARLERPAPPPAPPRESTHPPRPPFGFFDHTTYPTAVDYAKREIASGNAYQICLTHRVERDLTADSWSLYRRLRELNPAPFASYFDLGEVAIASSSPERFLHLGPDRVVESRPIKGTRPRAADVSSDRASREQLAESPKDRAENLMIVDLVRNDLGRVCEVGSVSVPDLMTIEPYAAVFQMVSTVRGRLREDRDRIDLIRAAFPPGSMTGAPKLAAMQIIERLEPVRRGIYSGAIGYLDVRGGLDLSVVIRTVLVKSGRAYIHAGGGIVADSDPTAEWKETQDKSRPLNAAITAAESQSPPAPQATEPLRQSAPSKSESGQGGLPRT
jgi:para-aminobenzoate synthetase component 1